MICSSVIKQNESPKYKMRSLHLNYWNGRLGNNLLQLSNALFIAEKYKCILRFISHPVIKNKVFNFSDGNSIPPPEETIKSEFWFSEMEHVGSPMALISRTALEQNRHKILKKYVLPLLPYSPINLDYDLVVHFRGGDILDKSPHPFYIQSPVSYFKKIFKTENASNILLVSEGDAIIKSPVIKELLKSEYNCTHQTGTISVDLNYILNAKILIAGGISSFCTTLAQCSPNLEKFYYPIYEDGEESGLSIRNNFILDKNVVNVYHNNYIKYGGWRRTDEQKLQLVTHLQSDIQIGDR